MVACSLQLAMTPAKFSTAPHQAVPADRLIQNITAHVAGHPDDLGARYALGRAHATVVAHTTSEVRGYYRVPTIKEFATARRSRIIVEMEHRQTGLKKDTELDCTQLAQHAMLAIEQFRILIAGSPEDPEVWLSYAYLLTSVQGMVGEMPMFSLYRDMDKELAGNSYEILERAIEEYKDDDPVESELIPDLQSGNLVLYRFGNIDPDIQIVAMQMVLHDPYFAGNIHAEVTDLIQEHLRALALQFYFKAAMYGFDGDVSGQRVRVARIDKIVSYEAAASYLAFRKEWWGDLEEDEYTKQAKMIVSLTKDLPPHAITPIIFSLNKPASLESLLAPETTVTFDLDGTGRDQAWPWVSPETAILVWDPEESGEITSGRQLFGSVSWWLFFDDGYRALDALDDNRDGELAGDELPGLAIWTDANSNGVSDPGEVVPIAKTGIEAISCRQTDTELGMPANYSGLRMTDGRVLPTYDWVAESVGGER